MDKETVDGDLKAAINGYKEVISQRGATRAVVAQALLRLGMAFEKRGDAEARKPYERLVREFGDQPAVVQQARARIAERGVTVASAPTVRRICSGDECNSYGINGRWLTTYANNRLTIRDLSTGRSAQFAETPAGRRICCLQFSSDGNRLAYTITSQGLSADAQIVVANTDGGDARTVYRGASSEAWSPDARRILVARGGQSARLSWVTVADGSAQSVPTSAWENMDSFSVSPDGRYIAFSGNRDPSIAENVYVIAADGSGETRVSASPNYQEPVGWSSDGRYLLYMQTGGPVSLWAAPITDGRVRGPAVLVRQFGNERVSFLGLTEAGAVRYRVLVGTSDIYTASMDPVSGRVTSPATAIPTARNGTNVSPRWSPESRRLLYQSAGPNTVPNEPQRELRVISLEDGTDLRVAEKVTYGGDAPCWSPDGRSILVNTVTATRPLREEPARVDLTTGEPRILFPGASTFRMRNCSDSLMPAFQAGSIKVRNIQTGAETEAYKFARNATNYGMPRISHDGRSVVFLESVDENTSALMMVPATGGPARALSRARTPAEFQPLLGFAWSPDDRFVYFLKRANTKAPHELFRVPAAGGAEEPMGLQGADLRDLDIAPDGRRIAFSIGAVGRPEIWALENFLPSGN
jgi:Tol biopolymer transport system component